MAETVLARLRAGVPIHEIASPFDRRALAIYVIIAAQTVIAIALVLWTGFRVTPSVLIALPAWSVALLGSAMLLRRYGHGRASGIMEATALSYIQGLPSIVVMFPLTALSAPFADSALAKADASMGFDARQFAALFAGKLDAQYVLSLFYHSFNWQPLIVVPALFLSGRGDRGWQFTTAACLAAVLTAAIFPFVPAVGTFQHFHIPAADFPNIASARQFGEVLRLIKHQHVRAITPSLFTGFVSFPSYHAAAAALFVWAMWPFRRMRWLFLLLNLGMCVSALIVGAHYMVDLLSGAILGLASAWIACRVTAAAEITCKPVAARD